MSKRTKIVVLHMKELIYTGIFVGLGILLVILAVLMFRPKDPSQGERELPTGEEASGYASGIYKAQMELNERELEVQVVVSQNVIEMVTFTNLDDSAKEMYPLMQPVMENISRQLCDTQDLEKVNLGKESPYTYRMIIDAIQRALQTAK